MDRVQTINLKNYSAKTYGSFCQNCGQPASIERFTMRRIFAGIFRVITLTEKGLCPQIRDLSLRPAEMIRGYLEGRRKKYSAPCSTCSSQQRQFFSDHPASGVMDAVSFSPGAFSFCGAFGREYFSFRASVSALNRFRSATGCSFQG